MVSLFEEVKRLEAEGKSSTFINRFIAQQSKSFPVTKSPTTIVLTPPPKKKKKRSKIAKGLDILSSVLLEPTTFIKSPTPAGEKVAARRADVRAGVPGAASSIIAETITSTLIAGAGILGGAQLAAASKAGVLGATLTKAGAVVIPTTLRGKLLGLTGIGILTTSQAARGFLGGIIQDPTKAGREAGLLIEKALAGEETGGFVDALKKAGIIGGIVAGGAGAIILGKKLLGKGKTADAVLNTPSGVPGSIALPVSVIPDSLAPITEAPVVAEIVKEVIPIPEAPDINIKVINKPQINLAMAQSI